MHLELCADSQINLCHDIHFVLQDVRFSLTLTGQGTALLHLNTQNYDGILAGANSMSMAMTWQAMQYRLIRSCGTNIS
jgi:hypothetical protein